MAANAMDEPSTKAASFADGGRQGKAIGVVYADAVAIYLHEDVIEQIIEYSHEDCSRETGGFLIGHVRQDEPRRVEIRHFLPARDARSRAASLRFTHDTWSSLHREIESKHPGESIVGWHHTHPGFGVFLSGYDLFIHRNYFRQPWHVALVVDPQRREFGFFQWRDGQVADCGFVCFWDRPRRQIDAANDEELTI